MTYHPPAEILARYADLLINFALGSGEGIKPGETVILSANEAAKPLYAELCRTVWRAGGHVISRYSPSDDAQTNLTADFLAIAGEEQLEHFAKHYWQGIVEQADHSVGIRAIADPRSLAASDPDRVLRNSAAMHGYYELRNRKENAGKFTWVLAIYGTPGMAAEAQMSIEQYWQQIIAGCRLEDPDPIASWREINAQLAGICAALNELPIERLHVEGPDADLWITLGEQRCWLGGGTRNIPSYEVFTTPDARGTEGWIRFNQPLYRYGSLIEGIELRFSAGTVTEARSSNNQSLLEAMLSVPGAKRIGEFSLTDGRLSPITRFMADTLFDENTGGPQGNTHLALGRGLPPCLTQDVTALSAAELEQIGYNSSAIHTDIVSTAERTVTATLTGGDSRVIYRDGQFTL